MNNKVQIILENINKNCDDLLNKVGSIDEKTTTVKQGKYIKSLINELDINCGTETAKNVMRPCGYKCISEKCIKTAKVLYEKSNNIDEFLDGLNANNIGGGHLHMKDKKIIAIYDKCYCGLAKSTEGISPIYCECSAGWFEKLFSVLFERCVVVNKVDTILNGADKCTFEISV